ncbi:uncharacterized protein [Neodiprion pinetum]|uniref:uncharacterized protein n=1 Tax=Neodiprion pinetum TaxID=441929 RepID=UPI0037193DF8
MSANAERIMGWAAQNKLKLNVSKTKAIVLGSPYYINSLPTAANTYFYVGGARVDYEFSVRSLWVILGSKLNCKDHILQLCKRAHSLMYPLYFLRKSTNFQLRKNLIQSLLFPIVDYCSLTYCYLTQELDTKLQRLINTGIRYIYGVRRDQHITPYRRKLQWLTTAGRRRCFPKCVSRVVNELSSAPSKCMLQK